MSDLNLTEAQREVLERFPASRRGIADNLNISLRAVRYRMNAMEDYGYDFVRDSEGIWNVIRPEEEPERTNSYHRSTAKKKLNNALTEIEKDVKDILNSTAPIVSEISSDGDEVLLIPQSDCHIGAEVDARNDEDIYSPEIAEDRINQHIDKAVVDARDRDVTHVEYVMMGDMVDGEDIYPGHNMSLQTSLQEQIKMGTRILLGQIRKLSDEFESVAVRCIGGNHGRLSQKSSSNADGILYDFLEIALDNGDFDNVTFQKTTNGQYINFDVLGHTFHTRHGQGSLQHVGTSSGKRRWLEWKDMYGYDIGLRGHYHTIKRETVGNGAPIYMAGSPCPPSLYAESLGEGGRPSSMYLFISEDGLDDNMEIMYY